MNLKDKNGISLIVLVITIIVILILAAAVIITLNNSNPIADANKAKYESDRANMQAVLTLTVGKVMAQNRATVSITAGQINAEVTGVKETTGTVNYTVKNAVNSNNSSGTVEFNKGTNTETKFYTGKKLPIYGAGDTKWYVDSEGNILLEVAGIKYGEDEILYDSGDEPSDSTIISASAVANAPTIYYGEKILNYTAGYISNWKIFYSDSSNIYLIATDYVDYDLLPTKTVKNEDGTETVYALNKDSYDTAYFTDMLPAYNGSEDIKEDRIKALNSSYHEYITTNNLKSESRNMKSIAYMMDTSIWEKFKGEKAEYVIGGPTIEMLMKSYSQTHEVDYRAKATSINGYQISKDGGINWANNYNEILDTSDTLYVAKSICNGMWIASPSATHAQHILYTTYNGHINSLNYSSGWIGFRPVVCLNSNVTLRAVEDGYEIE